MDDQTITAAYRWTAEECLAAHKCVSRPCGKNVPIGLLKWMLGLLLGGFVFMNLVVMFVMHIRTPGILSTRGFWQELIAGWSGSYFLVLQIIGLFVLVFGGYWLVTCYLVPRMGRKRVLKHFAENPKAEVDIQITIDPEELVWEFGEATKTTNKWQVYSKIIRADDGFLFYIDNCYNWIPNHAFSTRDDIPALSRLAREKAPNYEEIGLAEK